MRRPLSGPRPRRKRPEDALHVAVAKFLNVALPPDCLWTTIGHGDKLSARAAAMLKAKGLKPGWPDIFLLWSSDIETAGELCAAAIELKAKAGVQSASQKDFERHFVTLGGYYFLCRSIDDVERALRSVGIPLAARVMGGGIILGERGAP